jgi:hypothetical protein
MRQSEFPGEGRMLRRLLTSFFVLFLLLALPASALAQDYYFGVPQEVVNVYWNDDGTLSLDYVWTVDNQPGGHAIEYWDVGMPNDSYDLGSVHAEVNGVPVGISQSDYLGSGPGFSIALGSEAIQPGETGTLHLSVDNISRALYPDSQDSAYTSARFAPSYFGSQYVTGDTDLTVSFHLPPGVQPEEPRYHIPEGWPGADEPVTGLDAEGRATYTWQSSQAEPSGVYTFGASFPGKYVPAGTIILAAATPVSSSAPTLGIGTWLGNLASSLFNLVCFGGICFLFVGLPIIGAVQARRRKFQYIPPRIGIEGHGIKRGLTAVEAAVLMEEPLDKVLTMILFGVVKKDAAQVLSREPLKIQVTDPIPEGLYDYERSFLEAFKQDAPRTRQTGLEAMMVALIRSLSEKMKGFSRRETVDYYKTIMERAWQQVEAADTPEVKGQKIDENLEWTMLDRNYDDRARNVFRGPVIVPMWWGHYDPSWHAAGAASATPSIPSLGRGSSGALPGADFAASVVGGVQTFSQRAVGNVSEFTSRITNKTNPPPPPSKGGGGSRSGGGCACACACAGCACACAGGGR